MDNGIGEGEKKGGQDVGETMVGMKNKFKN